MKPAICYEFDAETSFWDGHELYLVKLHDGEHTRVLRRHLSNPAASALVEWAKLFWRRESDPDRLSAAMNEFICQELNEPAPRVSRWRLLLGDEV